MVEQITGVILLVLAGYQLYSTYKIFDHTKTKGDKNTSPFLPFSLWSSIIFSLALISIGISFMFKLI